MQNCIEAKRKELGMTRAEFAAAMHVDYTTVWKWENGKMLPDPSRLTQLAHVLKTPLTVLFPDLFGVTP
jgi:transcriptional regulator with XRE-family HTH domain